MQYECKLRDLEKLVHSKYARDIKGYKDTEHQLKQDKVKLKEEINVL